MRTVIAVVTSIAVACGLALVPAAASANDSSTVDYAEFAEVKMGYTVAQVGKIFDSPGVTTYARSGLLEKWYRVAYGEQLLNVRVMYIRRDGALRVITKEAKWTWMPNSAHDPATKTEYLAIKQGMTLAQVRGIIGSAGTRALDSASQTNALEDPPRSVSTMRGYVWPQVGGVRGDVLVRFLLKQGVYVVHLKGGVTWK